MIVLTWDPDFAAVAGDASFVVFPVVVVVVIFVAAGDDGVAVVVVVVVDSVVATFWSTWSSGLLVSGAEVNFSKVLYSPV